ncbi:MAG TPA: ABC-F family ATP-binding cassette domain-containing protein [Anaerolineaceae bacterium]|nr:ABC-F family ATP-binding cassette domain-containing protein [Anaerolineaceae bacterium]HOG78961.1 ABC-F family ATP-binding cassette domain-containing protein [Anaerolineaceae bacterium]HQN42932.1 ABC-F family ATP-binding cassette domain-containing protein [Anaerolineaceae bacterium]
MSLITTENLGLSFGAFDLFLGITVHVPNDGKIGLIGPNGIGKTSLVRILAGLDQPTAGRVYLARGRRIGYLRQEAVDAFADRTNTVYEEMLTAFEDLRAQQTRLNELEARMSAGDHAEALLQQYGDLQHAFEQNGGYNYEVDIQQTLEGLDLGKNYWHMPLAHLSGGQKTRALLARLLLEKPDLLILDEPTNHLDTQAVEWLEHTLGDWRGAVLIVSHDRYFLDNTVDTIWEMSRAGIETYSGNYSSYLVQREERWEYYEKVFEEEKTRLLNEVDYIQRNWVRDSTHAQALGRLRRLSRDIAIVENFGLMALRSGKKWSEMDLHVERPLDVIEAIRAVNAIQMPGNRPTHIRPRLASDKVSGSIILRAQDAAIGYPGNNLFNIREVELRRGECAALLGPNGSGKTTFLKVLLGQLDPLSGSVNLGASLQIGYFAQSHDALKGDHNILDELARHKPLEMEQARSHLAQYLFRGDDVFKQLSSLSGGERARLALAILALDGANFLLLDEPTNHLDMPAREALQDVLDSFPGTILLVSHDRYLVDQLATQIWEIRDGALNVFKGSYREFVLRRATAPGAAARTIVMPPKPIMRGNDKEERRRVQALNLLEERIHEQETRIQRLSSELQRAGQSQAFERIQKLSREIGQAQTTLEELISEWEKLAA